MLSSIRDLSHADFQLELRSSATLFGHTFLSCARHTTPNSPCVCVCVRCSTCSVTMQITLWVCMWMLMMSMWMSIVMMS